MSQHIEIGNLYDLNKQAILQEGRLGKRKLQEIKEKIADWFNMKLDGYAMLLCRERYDFTVFHLYEKQNKDPAAVAASELIEVLKERGEILSIEKDTEILNDAWEIWLKIDNEAYAYYLFGCDEWVIEC